MNIRELYVELVRFASNKRSLDKTANILKLYSAEKDKLDIFLFYLSATFEMGKIANLISSIENNIVGTEFKAPESCPEDPGYSKYLEIMTNASGKLKSSDNAISSNLASTDPKKKAKALVDIAYVLGSDFAELLIKLGIYVYALDVDETNIETRNCAVEVIKAIEKKLSEAENLTSDLLGRLRGKIPKADSKLSQDVDRDKCSSLEEKATERNRLFIRTAICITSVLACCALIYNKSDSIKNFSSSMFQSFFDSRGVIEVL